MNLLDSIKQGLAAMLLIPVLFACNDSNDVLDLDIDNDVEANYQEFSLPMKTIFIDSLRTDSEVNSTIGNYIDRRWGSISATSYNSFNFSTGQSFIGDSITFDSLWLSFELEDKIFTDDTQAEGEIYIYKLADELYSSVAYTADKKIAFEGEPLDTIPASFLNSSDTTFSFNLRGLSADFAAEIIDSNFGGLSLPYAFVPSDDMSALFTLNTAGDTSKITVFSSYDSINYTSTFIMNGTHFSNIDRDRTGSEIAGIENLDTIDISPEPGVLAPLFGLYPVVDISDLINFVGDEENILINRAEIILESVTVQNESSGIRYYFYKPNSGIKGEGLFGDFFDWINTAILQNEAYIASTNRPVTSISASGIYQSDITLFSDFLFNEFVENGEIVTEKLVITPVRYVSTERSLFSGNPQLKVYYTIVKN